MSDFKWAKNKIYATCVGEDDFFGDGFGCLVLFVSIFFCGLCLTACFCEYSIGALIATIILGLICAFFPIATIVILIIAMFKKKLKPESEVSCD